MNKGYVLYEKKESVFNSKLTSNSIRKICEIAKIDPKGVYGFDVSKFPDEYIDKYFLNIADNTRSESKETITEQRLIEMGVINKPKDTNDKRTIRGIKIIRGIFVAAVSLIAAGAVGITMLPTESEKKANKTTELAVVVNPNGITVNRIDIGTEVELPYSTLLTSRPLPNRENNGVGGIKYYTCIGPDGEAYVVQAVDQEDIKVCGSYDDEYIKKTSTIAKLAPGIDKTKFNNRDGYPVTIHKGDYFLVNPEKYTDGTCDIFYCTADGDDYFYSTDGKISAQEIVFPHDQSRTTESALMTGIEVPIGKQAGEKKDNYR